MGTAPVKQIKSESSYMRRLAFFLALARANLPQSLRGTEERVQKEGREGDLRIEGFKDGEGNGGAGQVRLRAGIHERRSELVTA